MTSEFYREQLHVCYLVQSQVPQVPKKSPEMGQSSMRASQGPASASHVKCEPGKSIENLGEIVISIQFKFPLYS